MPTTPATSAPAVISGLSEIASGFDGLILDLWGTLHDGVRPLPGAVEALANYRAGGGKVLILSNAPRRIDAVIERMDAIGIEPALYDAVLSSGEATWLALKARGDAFHRGLGEACYLIGYNGDDSAVLGLDLNLVDDIDTAEFIVCVGLASGETVDDYADMLEAAALQGLPMVCANPDIEVLRDGVRELCAGALARHYGSIGGAVHQHGKPHAPIYDLAFQQLGLSDKSRILAVGDSLHTDVAGGVAAGVGTLFIASGIHAEAMGHPPFGPLDAARLGDFSKSHGVRPHFACTAFRW